LNTFADVHIPVKHYGLDDDEYSLLHVEERTYQDESLHHLIVLSSPYSNTEIRHCWDSLEVKQLRMVHEGVYLEFCPHCSRSLNFVKLGFTLRLLQGEIENCLEFFCEYTSAKRKRYENHICEMINHYNLCSHSPPVRPAPNPPTRPTNMHVVLYNISDPLFKDKQPSLNRASRSKLDTAANPANLNSDNQPYTSAKQTNPEPQHYANLNSGNQTSTTTTTTTTTTTQQTSSELRKYANLNSGNKPCTTTTTITTTTTHQTSLEPRHYANLNSDHQPCTATQRASLQTTLPIEHQMENNGGSTQPPITARKRISGKKTYDIYHTYYVIEIL